MTPEQEIEFERVFSLPDAAIGPLPERSRERKRAGTGPKRKSQAGKRKKLPTVLAKQTNCWGCGSPGRFQYGFCGNCRLKERIEAAGVKPLPVKPEKIENVEKIRASAASVAVDENKARQRARDAQIVVVPGEVDEFVERATYTNFRRTLSPDQKQAMCGMHSDGWTRLELSKRFGISQVEVGKILNTKVAKHA